MFKRCFIVLSSPIAASYGLMAEILEEVNEIRSLATDCLMLSSHWVVLCLRVFLLFFFFSVTIYKIVLEISWDLMEEISFKTTGRYFTLAQATAQHIPSPPSPALLWVKGLFRAATFLCWTALSLFLLPHLTWLTCTSLALLNMPSCSPLLSSFFSTAECIGPLSGFETHMF